MDITEILHYWYKSPNGQLKGMPRCWLEQSGQVVKNRLRSLHFSLKKTQWFCRNLTRLTILN